MGKLASFTKEKQSREFDMEMALIITLEEFFSTPVHGLFSLAFNTFY